MCLNFSTVCVVYVSNSFFPSVQDGEQWKSKCVSHLCDKGRVITEYVTCKKPTKPSCKNKLPPVRVYDEGGCCFHYECRGVLELKVVCVINFYCFLKIRLRQQKKILLKSPLFLCLQVLALFGAILTTTPLTTTTTPSRRTAHLSWSKRL